MENLTGNSSETVQRNECEERERVKKERIGKKKKKDAKATISHLFQAAASLTE
jgi:hypothetical protein